MITAGIDIGARTAKAVILGPDGILASEIRPVDDVISQVSRKILKMAIRKAKIRRGRVVRVGATGYGGMKVKAARVRLTTPMCVARAAYYLDREVKTVIDIGGLITRVIKIGEDGHVQDYTENDKCASGGGRFLEMIADALEIPLDQIGPVSLSSEHPLHLTSQCVVFAESEVISHVNADEKPADILAGLHRSIAERTASLARKMVFAPPFAIIGGVAKNAGVLHFLKMELDSGDRELSEDPRIISALGAALLVREGKG